MDHADTKISFVDRRHVQRPLTPPLRVTLAFKNLDQLLARLIGVADQLTLVNDHHVPR